MSKKIILPAFVMMLAAGCTHLETVDTAKLERTKTVAVVSYVGDELSAWQQNYISSDVSWARSPVDWNADLYGENLLRQKLAGSGYTVVGNLRKPPKPRFEDHEDPKAASFLKELVRNNMDLNADVFLVMTSSMISIPRNAKANAVGGFLGGALGGVIAAESSGYMKFDGFYIHESPPPTIRSCSFRALSYVVDGKTGEILGRYNAQAREGLDSLDGDWPRGYAAFSQEDKTTIKRACIGALNEGVTEAVEKLGFTGGA